MCVLFLSSLYFVWRTNISLLNTLKEYGCTSRKNLRLPRHLINYKYMANFKLVSLNVSGDNFHKHRSMFTWCHILYSSRDIFRGGIRKTVDKWVGWEIYYSHGSPNSCRVIVLIRNRLNCTIHRSLGEISLFQK